MSIHPNNYNLRQVLSESGDLYIPWFQRDYTWDEDNIEELFLDLFDEYSWETIAASHRESQPLRDYFMGTVMLCGPGQTARMVLDGQQRLTTLTIMIAHLLKLMTKHKELAELHRDGMTVLRNPKKNNANRLCLKQGTPEAPRDCDDLVYCRILDAASSGKDVDIDRNDPDPDRAALADRQIYQTYNILAKKLDDSLQDAPRLGYDEQLAIRRLFEILTNRLHFVSVRADDEDYAIKFFETLNARGEKLRSDDLVKNALFLQAEGDPKMQQHVISSWNKFASMITDSKERIDFLRFLWNSQHVFIGKSHIYRSYKRHFLGLETKEEIKDFCSMLEFQGSFYRDISKASGNFEFCRGLALLGAKICRPVLLAVNHKYRLEVPTDRRQKVQEIVRLLEAIMMRCSICEQVTTALEKGFSEVARDIHTSANTWQVILADVRKKLGEKEYMVPTNSDFEHKLSSFSDLTEKDLQKQKWRVFFATLDRFVVNPDNIYIPTLTDIKLSFIVSGRAQYQMSIGNVRTTLDDDEGFNKKTINPSLADMASGNWTSGKVGNQKKRIIDAALECWKT
jgi:hypothetical protein